MKIYRTPGIIGKWTSIVCVDTKSVLNIKSILNSKSFEVAELSEIDRRKIVFYGR